MSYTSILQMANSNSLRGRITACVAQEGIANPGDWAAVRMWKFVSTAGWAAAWDYAKDTATDDHNPDTGARPSVITDQMIYDACMAIQQAEAAAPTT